MTQPKRFARVGSIDFKAIRAANKAHNERLDETFAKWGPAQEDEFAVEFTRELEQRAIDAATAAEHEAKARAQRARENPLEGTIQARIVRELERHGWKVMRRGVGSVRDQFGKILFAYGEPGEPDLEVLPKRGRPPVYIEVKTADGDVRENQKAWIAKRRADGYVAGIARSVEDAMALMVEALGPGARDEVADAR